MLIAALVCIVTTGLLAGKNAEKFFSTAIAIGMPVPAVVTCARKYLPAAGMTHWPTAVAVLVGLAPPAVGQAYALVQDVRSLDTWNVIVPVNVP